MCAIERTINVLSPLRSDHANRPVNDGKVALGADIHTSLDGTVKQISGHAVVLAAGPLASR
ncbi:hypothetical protein FACS1894170_13290 [Planctomycetales bacterium]|nr:hypothetical protein FACS1894170_13290 [Planctomycetales bacterium]